VSPINELGQPIGESVAWKPASLPVGETISGSYCRLEPLDSDRHAASLHSANTEDDGRMWTYMGYGPFASLDEYATWSVSMVGSDDPQFFAIVVDGAAVGVASFLRIEPTVGVIEVGHIAYSPRLQRTAAATEAMYLMMRHALEDLGYRRYEWKCDALNGPSRQAALRLGFTFEGVFRQATIYKGRNRDTAWYSVVGSEWPALKSRFEAWLDGTNFSADGVQVLSLAEVDVS
jgi:RimJ/RimL family protein N-acetyltransferase